MARLDLRCPRCGEPLDYSLRETPMPGEVIIDITVKPCAAWCRLLTDGDR